MSVAELKIFDSGVEPEGMKEKRMLCKLIEEKGTKYNTITAATGINENTLRQFKNTDYTIKGERLLALREYLISVGYWEEDPAAPPANGFKSRIDQMEFVDTETARRVRFVITNSLECKDFGMICGPSGCGKTGTVKRWMEEHPGQAILITANGSMTKRALLKRIAKAIDVKSTGDADTLIERIRDELVSHPRLIILDEADQLKRISKYELLRTIYDECDAAGAPIGMVWIGNLDLSKLLLQAAVDREELSRLHNRFGAFQMVEMPSRSEAEALMEGFHISAPARNHLVRIACNKRKGGIRVLRKVLTLLLAAAADGPITEDMVLSEGLAKSVLSLNA